VRAGERSLSPCTARRSSCALRRIDKNGSSGNPVGGRKQGSECNDDCRRIPASSHGASSAGGRMTRRMSGGDRPPALRERRSAGKVTPAPRIRSAGYACLRSEPSNFPQSTRRDRPGAFRLRSAPSGLPQACKTPAWARLPAPPGAAGIRSTITHSIPGSAN
jgi:hypothetical protein